MEAGRMFRIRVAFKGEPPFTSLTNVVCNWFGHYNGTFFVRVFLSLVLLTALFSSTSIACGLPETTG